MRPPTYIADADFVLAVELEGLTVLFHAPSGTTHILAPPSPQILEVLAQGPGASGDILARLAERFEFPAENGAAAVAARLAELEAAGLVRRV